MDNQRLILLLVFGFSVLMLWQAWEKEHAPQAPAQQVGAPTVAKEAAKAVGVGPSVSAPASTAAPVAGETIRIQTDLLNVELNTAGASLQRVELLKHKDAVDASKNFVLLGQEHAYFAQSGLIGEGWPNHRSIWRAIPGERELRAGADKLEVRLVAQGPNGVTVEKRYVFHRDSYVVDVQFEVANRGSQPVSGHAYFQLVRDNKPPAGESAMRKSFTGPVLYTSEKAFQKLDFGDIDKGKADYVKQAADGWIGMAQHYFVSVWLPPQNTPREYYVKKLDGDEYSSGVILAMPAVAPGASSTVGSALYVGPQEQQRLKAAAPGLDLVVDFGWLTIIAWPLLRVLEFFHQWTGNWGVAIILLTVAIKTVFFPLSAASYKSMAKMKLVTPRLNKIRETYAHDRQKMNQAMMDLYKTEKINPLGGCFPIVVQIPVFIALYWVLLAAIELRHAPFALWVKDLSALDPYYVLPVLMSISMVIQTRMNPKPPDPVQAKIMTFMPFVFSVFFFFFPSGLVLYWLVNNVLSILQQWQIQRMFDRDRPARAKR
jgi:YidC/Oxa1 family membrane protein insertase